LISVVLDGSSPKLQKTFWDKYKWTLNKGYKEERKGCRVATSLSHSTKKKTKNSNISTKGCC
jgi:hypothetical protein